MHIYSLLSFITAFIITLIYNRVNYNKLDQLAYSIRISYLPIMLGCIFALISFIRLSNFQNVGTYIPIEIIFIIILIHRGLSKVSIGKNGIYIGGVFFYWDEVDSFHWNHTNINTLICKVKTRKFYLLGRRKIKQKISKEDKFKVNNLLQKHGVTRC